MNHLNHNYREKIVSRLVSILDNSRSIDGVVSAFADEIRQWLNPDECYWIYDERLLDEAICRLPIKDAHAVSLDDLGMTTLSRYNEVPLLVEDMDFETEETSCLKNFLSSENYKGFLSVPVSYDRDHGYGFLFLLNRQPSPSWEKELTSLELVTVQLGTILYLNETRQRLQYMLDRERLLARIMGGIISQTFDLERIIRETVQEVGRFFGADRCVILRYNTESIAQPVRVIEQYCRDEEVVPIDIDDLPLDSIRKGMENLVFLQDQADAPPQDLWAYNKQYNIQSDLSLHIFYRGIPMGLISLHQCCNKRVWDGEELSLLHSIAMQIGAAIYQAELYQTEQNAKQIAYKANKQKDKFIASMSHELRTPLHTIIAGASMAKEEMLGPLNDKQRQYMGLIYNSGEHLLKIINDLLDIAKIEAGKYELTKEKFKVQSLLDQSLEMIHPLLQEKNQTSCLTVKGDIPEYVWGDIVRLKQVMTNLLSNAHKFSSVGANIEIQCECKHEKIHFDDELDSVSQPVQLLIKVLDEGPGIESGEIKRLLQPFEQGGSPDSKIKGSGLGLAIAKKIMELHEGALDVVSTVGKGSEFSIILPIMVPEVTADEAEHSR